jgi:uncharacterized protein YhfF
MVKNTNISLILNSEIKWKWICEWLNENALTFVDMLHTKIFLKGNGNKSVTQFRSKFQWRAHNSGEIQFNGLAFIDKINMTKYNIT